MASAHRATENDLRLIKQRFSELPKPPYFRDDRDLIRLLIEHPYWSWWVDDPLVCGVYLNDPPPVRVKIVFLLPGGAHPDAQLEIAGNAFRDAAARGLGQSGWTADFSQVELIPSLAAAARAAGKTPQAFAARMLEAQAKRLNAWDNANERIVGLVRHAADFFEEEERERGTGR